MIIKRFVRALDERLGVAPLARRGLGKVFPDHWSFMLGEIALYAFVVLLLTGTFLTLFFEPSTADTVYHGGYAPLEGRHMSAAFTSTVSLSWDVRAGLLMRQTHHWAALVFIAAIVLHMLRIFFTGAFRKPREVNWVVGVTMLALAMLNGFSGYSLPDDLLSGTGLRIAYSVVQSIPIVGSWLAFLLFGGGFPAPQTVFRLYISHVLLVPALLATLITVHMGILIKQKHSQFPGPGRSEHNVVGSRLWPTYTVRTLGLFGYVLAVLFALGGLFQINPVWIYGPFDPASATSPAQPDWFVAWEEGALRLFPPADFHIGRYLVPTLFFPGVVLGALTFLGLYAWPFLEERHNRVVMAHQLLDRPRQHPARLGFGVGALCFYTLLTAAAADDIAARLLRVPVLTVLTVIRVLVLAVPLPAGLLAWWLARSLRGSTANGLAELTAPDLRTALRHNPAPAQPEPPSDAQEEAPHVEAWLTRSHMWLWRYVGQAGDGSPVVLTGNVTEQTEGEAVHAANTAYPGVTVTSVEQQEVPWIMRETKGARRARAAIGAAWLLAVLGRRRHRRQEAGSAPPTRVRSGRRE